MPYDRQNEIAESVVDVIGNTPLVYMSKRLNDTHARIAMKLENMNPMASVKDRLAMAIILKGERDGKLIPGESTIVEATSGNTGIALAQVGAIRGYKVVICMPDTMSKERRALISIFGAELILTPGKFGIKGANAKAKEIVAATPGAVLAEQFSTKYNAEIHYETTGPEIWAQSQGKVDVFVAGVGTGGTVTGTARYLKEKNSKVQVYAVEPAESPVLSGGAHTPHKIQGLGAGFVPDVFDKAVIDGIIQCPSDTAIAVARDLPQKEGVFSGISAGANVFAALEVARRPENAGKLIVVVIPSFGERYLSTALFSEVYEKALALPTTDVQL